MIQTQRIKLTFDRPVDPIQKVFFAYNNTFVLLAIVVDEQNRMKCQKTIFHIDSKGHILFWKSIKTSHMNISLAMIDQTKAVVSDWLTSVLHIIDLQTYKEETLSVKQLQFPESFIFSKDMYFFNESRYFALLERSSSIYGTIFKSTYFDGKKLSKDSQPLAVVTHRFINPELFFQRGKLNNHSKLFISQQVKSPILQFIYFTLEENPQGEIKLIKIANGLSLLTEPKDSYLKQIWQIRPLVFVAITYPKQQSKVILIINYFIVDASKNISEAAVRQIKLELPFNNFEDTSIKYSNFNVDIYPMDQLFEVRAVWREYNDYFTSFVVLRNQTEQTVILKSREPNSNPLTGRTFQYKENPIFIEFDDNIKKQFLSQIQLQITSMISIHKKKEVMMQMLLYLNEDFDDDLLQDAIELIVEA